MAHRRRSLSYNLLHGFKAARSAHRVRPGPRPGLRSCLRPAPARPAPVPHAEQISHLTLEKGAS